MAWIEKFTSDSLDGQQYRRGTSIGIVRGKLKFMKFTARAAGGLYEPYQLKYPFYAAWEEELIKFNRAASKGINNAKQTAGLDWCLMITEIKLVETMRQGLVASISFALVALTVATGNVIQAVLASLTIGLIIINVLAVVAYNGWELGSAESVGVVVCVGFAVDYVVHLAAHFIHSKHSDRNTRVRESLRELGISIIGGSVTTVAATCVLFLTTLILFGKFAILVISTIVLSLLYSLGFFAALCHSLAPMSGLGDLASMYHGTKSLVLRVIKCFRRKGPDVLQTLEYGTQQDSNFQTPREDASSPLRD